MSDYGAARLARDMTDAEAHAYDAAHSARVIASKLRELADEVERHAAQIERGDGRSISHAADLVNDHTQRLGNLGTHLWSVIRSAREADEAHRSASEQAPRG